jgi:hypothetical protein
VSQPGTGVESVGERSDCDIDEAHPAFELDMAIEADADSVEEGESENGRL